MSNNNDENTDDRLVTAKELLRVVWTDESRPSLQWLRQHTGKDVPATRVGRLFFYSPKKVRAALQIV
jgi:hypothetical protein